MPKITKEQYLELLHSCADNCPNAYCFFKVFLEHQHPDPRTICQVKCIEIFKWEESEREKKDIGLQESAMRWCTEGYAKAFAQVYEEGERIREIYKRTKAAAILNRNGNLIDVANVSSKNSTTTTMEIN